MNTDHTHPDRIGHRHCKDEAKHGNYVPLLPNFNEGLDMHMTNTKSCMLAGHSTR